MKQEEPKVKLAPYDLGQVFKLKRQITDALIQTYQDCVIEAEGLQDITDVVHDCLPGGINREFVYDSLRHLSGVKLDRSLLRNEAWRIAGNVRCLKAGNPILPWRVQKFAEWVPLQIIDCRLTRTPKRRKFGSVFTLRVLAGRACTHTLDSFWSPRFCRFFAIHAGFTSSWKDLPFNRMEELIRLRTYGLLRPADDNAERGFDGRMLQVQQYYVNSSLEKYNREILKKRARIGFQCPRNYNHACHQCHIGYYDCEAAVHPRTYTKHECDVCGKITWFDPMWIALGNCVSCQRKLDLAAGGNT